MGISLIIKGADFSEVAVDVFTKMPLSKGSISGSSSNYGEWDYPSPSFDNNRVKTSKYSGVKVANNGNVCLHCSNGISVSYAVYKENNPTAENCIVDYSTVGSYKTFSEDGLYVYNNNTGQDVYVYFIFKFNGADGIHDADADINPSDIEIKY